MHVKTLDKECCNVCQRQTATSYDLAVKLSCFPAVEVRLSYLETQKALLGKNTWVCCAVHIHTAGKHSSYSPGSTQQVWLIMSASPLRVNPTLQGKLSIG